MTTTREQRFIENEKQFRTANELLRERVEALATPDRPIPFFCECIDETCMGRLELSLQDYQRVRADDEHFMIAPGHPLLDEERVVEENGRFLLVTKEGIAHS